MKPTALLIDPATILVPPPRKKGDTGNTMTLEPKAVGAKEDQQMMESIKTGGIQIPLVCILDGERIILVDGLRRLNFAKKLGIPRVPVVIDQVPASEKDLVSYARRLRFILDEHRQDLFPSQRAELVEKLREQFKFDNKQLARYLGVSHASIANWLEIRKYAPEIVSALDAGALTGQAARVFVGMTEEGQRAVWKAHHGELTTTDGRSTIHKQLRKTYAPEKFPEYYERPKVITNLLASKQPGAKRKVVVQGIHNADKKKMLASMEVKEEELQMLKDEQKEAQKQIMASLPIISAMKRNPKLWKLVPEAMRPELERFLEVYGD